MLVALLFGVGIGMVGGRLIGHVNATWASSASTLVLWIGLAAPVVYAFVRARPAGLLRCRPTDFLWGVGVGLALRLTQGWLSGANAQNFPQPATLDHSLSIDWWLSDALSAGLIGPLIEEFFFRAVVLVTVFQLLKRTVGAAAASFTALMASAGIFVLLHAGFATLGLAEATQLFALGVACGLIVLLTGRLWGAVIAHVLYNATFLALLIVGAALS